MIILLGSQKGGCGKSTLAINISVELARQGKDVVLVDADPQGTSSRWAADRAEQGIEPAVHCLQKTGNIKHALADVNGRYDVVIVDTAGHDSRELRTGMLAADVLLSPFRPSQADLDTVEYLSKVVVDAKDLNENLTPLAVLTMTPTHPTVKEREEAIEYLSDFPEMRLLEAAVCERKVFRDALSFGKGVVEMRDEKAAQEIQNLVTEIVGGING